MKYIQLIKFKEDEYEVMRTGTMKEAKKLLEAGFDYVTEKTLSCCSGNLRGS
jgi:hypothetical protein